MEYLRTLSYDQFMYICNSFDVNLVECQNNSWTVDRAFEYISEMNRDNNFCILSENETLPIYYIEVQYKGKRMLLFKVKKQLNKI